MHCVLAKKNRFVLKCNHNSGLGMCICKDKSNLNIEKVKRELKKGLKQDYYLTGREWPYKGVPHKIIAEPYMEDEKYALFISLVDRDKARTEEKNVEKALVNSIKDSYETLKQMEKAYNTAKESLESAEQSYETALKENKLGLTTFSTLESMRAGMYETQKSLYEMQIEYAKALANFDFITSGYVSDLLVGGESVEGDYESGSTFADEFGEEEE